MLDGDISNRFSTGRFSDGVEQCDDDRYSSSDDVLAGVPCWIEPIRRNNAVNDGLHESASGPHKISILCASNVCY